MNIFFQWTVCETPGFTVKGAELQTTQVLHKDETISSVFSQELIPQDLSFHVMS